MFAICYLTQRQSFILKSDLNVQLLFGVCVHKLQGLDWKSSNSDSTFVVTVAVCQTAHLL